MTITHVAVPDSWFVAPEGDGRNRAVWSDEGPRYVSSWPRLVVSWTQVPDEVWAILEQVVPIKRMPHEVEVVHDGRHAVWSWMCAHEQCRDEASRVGIQGYETEAEAEESAQAHRRETSDFDVEELARG
jgi:hypothetical protein